jgi:iron complex transport system ATP-binding protein
MILRAREIGFAWPGRPDLLAGVDLDLAEGELVALVGANGSGKSTLLRILAGLLAPASGSVTLADRPLSEWGATERAGALAFLPQRVRPLYPLTVRRMVELARPDGAGGLNLDEALACCDVRPLSDRLFSELSGGERQRVLLAGALAQSGRVLLLDEPTAALDLPHAVSVLARLREQLGAGRAALVVTHDLNLAGAWSDRVLLLHEGRIAAAGPAAEVFRQELLERAIGEGIEVVAHPHTGQPLIVPSLRERRS